MCHESVSVCASMSVGWDPKRVAGPGGLHICVLIYSAKFLFKEALLISIPASVVYAYMFCQASSTECVHKFNIFVILVGENVISCKP